MTELSRRSVVAMSAGGLSALCLSRPVLAATQCIASGTSVLVPTKLTVDCASRRNFQIFRQNPDFVGLAGAVTMGFARGKLGMYSPANLFLFPWVKPAGKDKNLPAYVPASATIYVGAAPIPDATLPVDEYFCRFVLQAPWTSFIGFQVDKAFSASDAKLDWFTNVGLADGTGVGVDLTSPNLNGPWFGGSHWIPTDVCNGPAWRKLIVAGLQLASTAAC